MKYRIVVPNVSMEAVGKHTAESHPLGVRFSKNGIKPRTLHAVKFPHDAGATGLGIALSEPLLFNCLNF